MITKEDEEKLLKFSNLYRERVRRVSSYKDELSELQQKISKEVGELEQMKLNEMEFLNELQTKYEKSPQEIVQLLQKIILANG